MICGQSLEHVLIEMNGGAIPAPRKEAPPVRIDEKHDERVRMLDGMVKRLRAFVAELQEEIKSKDYENRRLQARIRKGNSPREAELAKDAEVIKKDEIIHDLKKHLCKEERYNRNLVKRLARIKQFAELSMDGDVLPVKVMDALTKDGLRRLADDIGIDEGDVVFVTRIDGWGRSVVKDLAEMRVKSVVVGAAVLAGSDPLLMPVFREAGVPLLTDKEALDQALLQWQGVQVRHEREKKTEMIEHIFKEYKSERGKEVKKSG